MTKGPDLAPHGRWDHGCSTIKYPNGTNLIIGKKHDAFLKDITVSLKIPDQYYPVFNLFWIHSKVA